VDTIVKVMRRTSPSRVNVEAGTRDGVVEEPAVDKERLAIAALY
jgi:hypothetical protein